MWNSSVQRKRGIAGRTFKQTPFSSDWKISVTERPQGILSRLTPLTPLDLRACRTVSDIVAGMALCSFGARMLGEVAATLTTWLSNGPRPVLIYDGKTSMPLYHLLRKLCNLQNDTYGKGFEGPYSPDEFVRANKTKERALIVGQYPERIEDELHALVGDAIFVNVTRQCKPGQVQDGYFPNVVFADPTYIMPLLALVFDERLNGTAHDVADLMHELQNYGGTAKQVVHGAYTLRKMLEDRRCTVMLTLSGAMTIAKMQRVITDLLDTGRIALVSATGALNTHGFVEGSGGMHYKHDPTIPDEDLAAEGLNRVTDTIEPEGNFDLIEGYVIEALDAIVAKGSLITNSAALHWEMGRRLAERDPTARAILATAYRQNIPVLTSAVMDSEVGNDIFVHNARRRAMGLEPIIFDQERDTRVLFALGRDAERLGIFTIGGGVPRNNTQNVGPLAEIYAARLGEKMDPVRFFYACRICPDHMDTGHLSGCTYREGATWRKFDFDGMLAEVQADATLTWPFMQKFATARLLAA